MIAYAAIFSALYLLLSYSSSSVFGPLFRGSEAHCFRAMTMAVIAARLAYPGGPIIMSFVSGFLLLFVPAPAAFLYLPGTIGAGVSYDYFLRQGNYKTNCSNPSKVVIGSVFSGIVESLIVTAGLFVIGFNFTELITGLNQLGFDSVGLIGILTFSISKNLILSFVGGLLGMFFIKNLKKSI